MIYFLVSILEKLRSVPHGAGVYQMLDCGGRVIYIGKAKNLYNRLASYFISKSHDAKTTAMLCKVVDFEYFVCKTENDALGLEANMINKHKPHYNILLKDNKSFPYIVVGGCGRGDPAGGIGGRAGVKIEITRQLNKKGKYFGPYYNGIWASGLLDTVYDVFGVRDDVGDKADDIKKFLSGEKDFGAGEILRAKMEQASELMQFELAIRYRNGLKFLDKLKERTIANVPRDVNVDVFGWAASADVFVVSVINVRAGKLIGVQNFSNRNDAPIDDGEKVAEFIGQYYLQNKRPTGATGGEFGADIVTNETAKIGYKKRLVEMAGENAREYLETSVEKIKNRDDFTVGACKELAEILGGGEIKRIECFDVSHLGGEDAGAAMAVFVDGVADKKAYRRFKVRHGGGACDAQRVGGARGDDILQNNDYESMREVLLRRFNRFDWGVPDLIVLDGGMGQLSAVLGANPHGKAFCAERGGVAPSIIAFGGERDDVFLPSGEVINLPRRSYALRLLQRVRDEAHRFANAYRVQRATRPDPNTNKKNDTKKSR